MWYQQNQEKYLDIYLCRSDMWDLFVIGIYVKIIEYLEFWLPVDIAFIYLKIHITISQFASLIIL